MNPVCHCTLTADFLKGRFHRYRKIKDAVVLVCGPVRLTA